MNDVIQLRVRRVWKARATDDIGDPKIATAFLIEGQTILDVSHKTKQSSGFKSFQEAYPKAELVAIEFIGEMS